jgi:phage tail-like protein
MTINASISASISTGPASRKDPLLPSKFWVEINGVMEAFFTECSGLSIQTEVMEYKEGGLNSRTHKLPVRSTFSNITLKKGMTTSSLIYQWYMKTVQGKPETHDFSIIVYSNSSPGKPVKRWNVSKAYPIKWSSSEFKASDGQGHLVETIELVHNGFVEVPQSI